MHASTFVGITVHTYEETGCIECVNYLERCNYLETTRPSFKNFAKCTKQAERTLNKNAKYMNIEQEGSKYSFDVKLERKKSFKTLDSIEFKLVLLFCGLELGFSWPSDKLWS